jgi:hypothetical protein
MEKKQYKKCGNCRAFDSGKCDLFFAIKPIHVYGVTVNGEPLEPCYKPTTIEGVIEATKIVHSTTYQRP